MAKRIYSTEQLVERWEQYQSIVNLMGRRSFRNLWKMEDAVFEEYWCKEAPDPSLGFNDGYYKGYESVTGYFKALHELNEIRAKAVQSANNDKLGKKSLDDLYGVGSCNPDNLTTPLVEIAEDNKTAKGLWYSLMTETDYTEAGCTTYHKWGWVAVDFVNEHGQWKIWHLIQTEDFKAIAGQNWAKGSTSKPADPQYAAIGAYKFPKPNVPMNVYEHFSSKRALKAFPEAPVAYNTFAETFSYGI